MRSITSKPDAAAAALAREPLAGGVFRGPMAMATTGGLTVGTGTAEAAGAT
jgi:hypothetical protein